MKISFKTYSSQSSLIGSIVFLCLGGILFTNANAVLDILSIGLGILLAVFGIINLVQYGSNANEGIDSRNYLVVGVISIVVSIIFIFFHDIVEQFVRFFIGGWILFIGIMRLINYLSSDYKNNKSLSLLIVSIALILLGMYTIIKSGLFLSTVGLVMMIYSTIEIIGFIFYSSKDNTNQEPEGTETLIIPEDLNDSDKKQKTTKKTNTKKNSTVKDVKTESKTNQKKSKKKTNNKKED